MRYDSLRLAQVLPGAIKGRDFAIRTETLANEPLQRRTVSSMRSLCAPYSKSAAAAYAPSGTPRNCPRTRLRPSWRGKSIPAARRAGRKIDPEKLQQSGPSPLFRLEAPAAGAVHRPLPAHQSNAQPPPRARTASAKVVTAWASSSLRRVGAPQEKRAEVDRQLRLRKMAPQGFAHM